MDLLFAVAPPAQLVEVDRLIRTAFTPYVRALGREIAPDAYGWFADAIVKGDIYVARDGAEIVGAICCCAAGASVPTLSANATAKAKIFRRPLTKQ